MLDDNIFSDCMLATIGLLGNLIEFSIHENSFFGPLPPELVNPKNLESLDLSMNYFSGSLPSSLGKSFQAFVLGC